MHGYDLAACGYDLAHVRNIWPWLVVSLFDIKKVKPYAGCSFFGHCVCARREMSSDGHCACLIVITPPARRA